MIAPVARARSGITLTEILISILIMGVGLISLATLFPLGLIRLRDAARFQRGASLAQSSTDDTDARSLLYKPSFTQTWYGTRDPFTTDIAVTTTNPVTTTAANLSTAQPLPGLPICYDPLWFAVANVVPYNGNPNNRLFDPKLSFTLASPFVAAEARFGAGYVGTVDAFKIRTNAPGDAGRPSAFGLQRISNFIPWSSVNYTPLYPFTYHNPNIATAQAPDAAGDTFTSLDDVIFNSNAASTYGSSPLLPDLTLSGNSTVTNDWRYTWFFTGRQVDSTNGSMFQGNVVVCDGRQFNFAPLPPPNATTSVPIGETVVEAVFGYSTQVNGPVTGFGVSADKTVLLRWPAGIADPQVRIGGWIADVTYERDATFSAARIAATNTPFQRCYWYQVVRRTDSQSDPDFTGYRRMVLTISSPVQAKTLLRAGTDGLPQFVNVALVMPSVINVYPRAFTIH